MNSPFRLLYTEDNPQDTELTLRHFDENAPEFEIETVGSGQACLERLATAAFDLLLLDYRLPDMTGLDVLKYLAQADSSMPVVLITSDGDEALVVKALRLGAADYVAKGGAYLETLPELLHDVVKRHADKHSLGLPVGTEPRLILYLEHLPMDIELTLSHFAENAPHFVVDVIQTCAAALERLALPHAYDLILLDLRMPDQCSLDCIREARRLKLSLPPFFIISGQGNDTMAIAAMKLGASDYLCKTTGYLDHLPHRIDCAIAEHRLSRLNHALRADLSIHTQNEENLRLYQIELKMQNEDLRHTQLQLDAAKQRYFDIFNLAPLSYCTFSRQGLVRHANLMATKLLGLHRQSKISHFILNEDQDIYYLFNKKLLKTQETQTCELRMLKPDGVHVWMHLSATLAVDDNGSTLSHLILKDISIRKQAEKASRDLADHPQTAREEERTRIAREIHDELGSVLAALKMDVSWMKKQLPTDLPLCHQKILAISRHLDGAIGSVRKIIADLRPSILDHLGLLAAIDWKIDEFTQQTGITCDLALPDSVIVIEQGRDITVFRIMQEALSNIIAHSGATRITFEVLADANKLTMKIADNGCGMTTMQRDQPRKYGILGMHERARYFSGKLDIDSHPGQGTALVLIMPLRSDLSAANHD